MNILFFTHYFPPEGNAPATRVHEFCRRWVKDGHTVTVITGVPNVPNGIVYEGYRNRLRQEENVDGIRTIRVWTYLAPNKGTGRRIVNYLSYMFSAILSGVFVKKPDVIIATSPQFFCGWAGAIVSKLRGLPFMLEVRDIWPESIEAVGAMSNRRLLRFLERLELRLYGAANHIVTVGEGYKQKLVEKIKQTAKISIIPTGVNLTTFSPRERDAGMKQAFGLQGCFVCSYIGTIGMASGLEVVLEAARILKKEREEEASIRTPVEYGHDPATAGWPSGKGTEQLALTLEGRAPSRPQEFCKTPHDIKFLLVGDGAVKADLEATAVREGLDNVVFTGRQNKARIPDFLALTDACLVHLKKKEIFETVMPSKIYEAAAMSKPIILGVDGYAAKLIMEAGAGICIEPENAGQLVDAVKRLAGDLSICRSFGEKGRLMVKQAYDCDRLAQKYEAVIRKVVGASEVNE